METEGGLPLQTFTGWISNTVLAFISCLRPLGPGISSGISMEYRDRLTIISEILQVCKERSGKTRIVYGANLNFEMLRAYVETLTETGLLMEDQGAYLTTEKGREFLRFFMAAKMLISEKPEAARLRSMLAYYGGF